MTIKAMTSGTTIARRAGIMITMEINELMADPNIQKTQEKFIGTSSSIRSMSYFNKCL
jgi:hypothetical protein